MYDDHYDRQHIDGILQLVMLQITKTLIKT